MVVTGLGAPRPAAPGQLGGQCFQVRGPEAAEGSSHSSTSRSGAGLTAYSRRVPTGRTVAKPLSRSTFRCWETAGWEIPNSRLITAQTAPRGLLAARDQLQDPAPHRVAEHLERVHGT